jgi:hypothetical protein
MEDFNRKFALWVILMFIISESEGSGTIHSPHLRDITWLKGFENCTNHIFLFNRIKFGVTETAFTPSHENDNYLTVGLYDNADRISKVTKDYRKNLFCQTVSIVYSNTVEELNRLEDTISNITIQMKDMNPIAAKSPNGTIQVLPTYYFLVGPEFIANKSFIMALFRLWGHQFRTFIFHIEASLEIDQDQFVPMYETFCFICLHCEVWNSGSAFTSKMFSPNLLKFNLSTPYKCPYFNSVGCRLEMDLLSSKITLSGQNLSWLIPVFGKFPFNLPKLRNLSSNKLKFHEVLGMKPHFDEVIMSILIEDVPKLSTKMKDIFSPWISVVRGSSPAFTTIIFGENGLTFLTCHGGYRGISFGSYLKPFQTEVWLALIFSVLISVTLFVILLRVLRTHYGWHDIVPHGNSEFTFGSVFFTVFALLMETEVYIGVVSKHKRFRWFMFAWLFGSLILSTAYRGDNISNIIVPSVSTSPLSSFSQLVGFTLYVKSSVGGGAGEIIQSKMKRDYGTSITSGVGMAFQKYLAWKYGSTAIAQIENDTNGINSFRVTSERDLTLIQLYKSLVNKEMGSKRDIEHQVLHPLLRHCNKTVFVADNAEVDYMLVNLKSLDDSKKYYRGSELLFPQFDTWTFTKVGGDYFPRRLTGLIVSGIFGFWQKMILKSNLGESLTMEQDENFGEEPKPISLQSNIIAIFFVFVALCIFTSFVFLLEMLPDIFKLKKQ